MQSSFFFGYMLMVCFGFFLMLGTVGWRASLLFVRSIFRWAALLLHCCDAAGRQRLQGLKLLRCAAGRSRQSEPGCGGRGVCSTDVTDT